MPGTPRVRCPAAGARARGAAAGDQARGPRAGPPLGPRTAPRDEPAPERHGRPPPGTGTAGPLSRPGFPARGAHAAAHRTPSRPAGRPGWRPMVHGGERRACRRQARDGPFPAARGGPGKAGPAGHRACPALRRRRVAAWRRFPVSLVQATGWRGMMGAWRDTTEGQATWPVLSPGSLPGFAGPFSVVANRGAIRRKPRYAPSSSTRPAAGRVLALASLSAAFGQTADLRSARLPFFASAYPLLPGYVPGPFRPRPGPLTSFPAAGARRPGTRHPILCTGRHLLSTDRPLSTRRAGRRSQPGGAPRSGPPAATRVHPPGRRSPSRP